VENEFLLSHVKAVKEMRRKMSEQAFL